MNETATPAPRGRTSLASVLATGPLARTARSLKRATAPAQRIVSAVTKATAPVRHMLETTAKATAPAARSAMDALAAISRTGADAARMATEWARIVIRRRRHEQTRALKLARTALAEHVRMLALGIRALFALAHAASSAASLAARERRASRPRAPRAPAHALAA